MDPRSNYLRKPPTPPASSTQLRSSFSPAATPSLSPSNSDPAAASSCPKSSTSTASTSIRPTTRQRLTSPLPTEPIQNQHDPSRRWSQTSEVTLVSSSTKHSPSNSYQSSNSRLDQLGYMNSDKQRLVAHHPYFHYPVQIPDRPLIERVTNQWQNDIKHKDLCHGDYVDEEDYAQFMSDREDSRSMFSWPRRIPRRAQRYLFLYCTFLLCCFSAWHFWFRPAIDLEEDLDRSMSQSSREGGFGINVRPEFAGLLQVQYLDSKLVPGATHGSPKRLIVVGDVHGCKAELLDLLEKVSFNEDSDHLVLAGDFIYKGPDSKGVIDIAKSLRASCVRGNHEDRAILAYASMNSGVLPLPGPDEDPTRTEDDLGEESFSHGDYKHRTLAKELGYDTIKWLQQCPVILHVGRIANQDYVVVHAGLAPGVSLEKQDPFQVMNMRTIDLQSRVPSESRVGEPWEKVWNHHQSHTHPSSQRTIAIYGHDSKRGLNIKKYSKGLDTGCVKGGKLTALVIDDRGKEKIVSVKCKNYHVSP